MNRRRCPLSLVAVCLLSVSAVWAQSGGELRFCVRSEPKTFNPLLVADDASETVRYLTGGVLMRLNRLTQTLEPELATTWQVSKDGRTITFTLRDKVYFSDGTPFSAEDVAFTVRQMMDPNLHSPTGDTFRSGTGEVAIKVLAPTKLSITFPAAVAGLDRLFDQVAIMSAKSAKKEMAVLGPFYIADYKSGSYILLNRNPNYWKHDSTGHTLPYLGSVKLDIQSNRDIEALRFRRGEIDLINSIDTEYYDKLAEASPALVRDVGPSLDSEQVWFNQVAKAPIPAYKLAWFRSQNFRRAVSEAINRDDLARVVFGSHARPATGPVSPANKMWFDAKLHPIPYDTNSAMSRLQQDGFRMDHGVLRDKEGHPVEFSIITNSGNKYRERMAAMIQQDLGKIGMKVNVVTLDFPSLIERITESFQYEGALLGLVNMDLDPNAVMNLWLSSGDNHQWNPRQKAPETAWEAEIDRLMREQASAVEFRQRKAAFDRVQEIVADQVPFIYLVNKNALAAVSTALEGEVPVALRPQTYWNVEYMRLRPELAKVRP
ncbi:MAG: ABC transporter substrate-binding protein [Terriglobales bacterium]